MYKLFAIMCILVNGESQCTVYNDTQQGEFKDVITCEQQAEYRFYTMMDGFAQYNIPFEKIIVGCEKSTD